MTGPVSLELRRVGVRWWLLKSPQALNVWMMARVSLGIVGELGPRGVSGSYGRDIASEAIEAAEALGI
jgi:hypothetical protein